LSGSGSFCGVMDLDRCLSFLFFFFFFFSFLCFTGSGEVDFFLYFLSCLGELLSSSSFSDSDFAFSSSLSFLLSFFPLSFLLLMCFMVLKSPSDPSECSGVCSFFGGGGGASVSDSLFPGEYLSLSLGGSGVGDFSFTGDFLGDGDLELDLLSLLAGRSGDFSEAELESRDLEAFFGGGEADLALAALLALPDLLLDFFFGDSFFGSGDFAGEAERSDSDPDFSSFFFGDSTVLSGESSFFAKFFRFTGEAELSDEEECLFVLLVFLDFLFLLPSDEDPPDDDDESLRAFFFLPRDLSSEDDVECRLLLRSQTLLVLL